MVYGQYVAAVIRRALQPGARFTDILQILAASAAPAVAKFLGLQVPTPEDVLAYIGAVALAFVVLRLFFVAPYQVWSEQVGQLGELKLELTKPERIELERIAKVRAKSRLQLAGAIREAQMHTFMGERSTKRFTKLQKEIARLAAFTQMGSGALPLLCKIQARLDTLHRRIVEGEKVEADAELGKWVANICSYLHGSLKDEDLASLSPLNTESEKPL